MEFCWFATLYQVSKYQSIYRCCSPSRDTAYIRTYYNKSRMKHSLNIILIILITGLWHFYHKISSHSLLRSYFDNRIREFLRVVQVRSMSTLRQSDGSQAAVSHDLLLGLGEDDVVLAAYDKRLRDGQLRRLAWRGNAEDVGTHGLELANYLIDVLLGRRQQKVPPRGFAVLECHRGLGENDQLLSRHVSIESESLPGQHVPARRPW